MNVRFDGQTVLVTGGTKGIGKQIALDFESLGASVILTGTSKIPPDFINQKKIQYISVNFIHEDEIETFLSSLNSFEKIDVCVNNAGINKINFIENVQAVDYFEMMKVNLEVPFRIIKTITPIMKKNQYGRIINISSIFGKVSREKRSVYSMTKNGLNGITVSTSIELAKEGILVNTVSPGFTLTDLTRKNLSKQEMEHLIERIPINRMAEVNEISNVVLFLASNFNTYISGQNIIVDGGFVNV